MTSPLPQTANTALQETGARTAYVPRVRVSGVEGTGGRMGTVVKGHTVSVGFVGAAHPLTAPATSPSRCVKHPCTSPRHISAPPPPTCSVFWICLPPVTLRPSSPLDKICHQPLHSSSHTCSLF